MLIHIKRGIFLMNDSIKDGNTVCVPSEMFKVKRAIFMAAGFGSRLAPVTISTPKPLVRVHGK